MNVSDLSRFPQTAAGKKAEVLGIGVSNLPLVDFLLQCGVLVTVRDRKSEEQLGNLPKELKAKGVSLITGEQYLNDLEGDYISVLPAFVRIFRKSLWVLPRERCSPVRWSCSSLCAKRKPWQ